MILYNTRAFYSKPIIFITKGDNINQRERQVVNLRGFKLDISIANVSYDELVMNWAIIHPKTAVAGTTVEGQVVATEFFRDYGTRRSVSPSEMSTRAGLEWVNAKVNTDLYSVLKRGRFTLNPAIMPGMPTLPDDREGAVPLSGVPEWTVPGSIYPHPNKGNSVRTKSMWIPIKRQIRFDQAISASAPPEQLWFVWWADSPFSSDQSGANADAFAMNFRGITYYREPKP